MTSSTAAVGEAPLIEASLDASLGSQDRAWKRRDEPRGGQVLDARLANPPHPLYAKAKRLFRMKGLQILCSLPKPVSHVVSIVCKIYTKPCQSQEVVWNQHGK